MLKLQTFSSVTKSKTRGFGFLLFIFFLSLFLIANPAHAQSSITKDQLDKCRDQGHIDVTDPDFNTKCINYLNPTPEPTYSGSNNVHAASTEEKIQLAEKVYNSSCPDPVKRLVIQYDDQGNPTRNPVEGDLYVQGTYVLANSNGTPIYLTCASASFFEQLIVRIFMILFSIIGLVVMYSITRSAITVITAFDDADKKEAGIKGLVVAIMYTVGLIFAYTVFVFVAVGVIGVGTGAEKKEYNLFCQNRIIVNLTFNGTEEC